MTRLSYVGQYLKRLQCHWHRGGDILFSTNQHLTSVRVCAQLEKNALKDFSKFLKSLNGVVLRIIDLRLEGPGFESYEPPTRAIFSSHPSRK